MALSYDVYVRELQEVTGERLKQLHVVGGGANNGFLCQLSADVLGMAIYAGPTEATVLGNLAVQMIADGSVRDIQEARDLIRRSFPVRAYAPRPMDSGLLAELRAKYRSFG